MRMPWPTGRLSRQKQTNHKEEEQLEDQRNVGENSCNSGDGTDQRVQSLMFITMMTFNPMLF